MIQKFVGHTKKENMLRFTKTLKNEIYKYMTQYHKIHILINLMIQLINTIIRIIQQ